MAFRNKVEVLLDVSADRATTTVKRFRTSIQEADGAVNKFKAGTNSAMASVKANAGAMAISAGVAITAFGVKSVKAFQDTALAAGKFSDATGVGVEAASRWREVASDIGVDGTVIEGAFNKMNKTLGTTPEKFEDYGVAIAKASDGTTDVSETFLNLVDRLNAIKDPAERARVASELLGKGWTGMAELIGQGSDELRESLAGVSDAQVISPKEEAKAKKTRAAMDDLKDSIDSLMLEVGEAVSGLVPFAAGLADIAGSVDDILSPLGGLAAAVPLANEGFLESAVPIAGWIDALSGAEVTATGLTSATEDLTAATEADTDAQNDLNEARAKGAAVLEAHRLSEHQEELLAEQRAIDGVIERLGESTDALDENADAADRTARAAQRAADAADAHVDALEDQQDALEAVSEALDEQAIAQRAAADSTFALLDASGGYLQYLEGLPEAIKEAKGDQLKLNEIYAEGRDIVVGLADATVENAVQQYASTGATVGATAKIDIWNKSMLESAKTAEGPLRDAILAFIAEANDIPPEKATEITALVNDGKFDEATRLLDEASETRKVALELEVNELAAARAQARIDAIAKARTIDLIFNEPVARGRGPDGAAVAAEPWVKKSVGREMSAVPGSLLGGGIEHVSTPAPTTGGGAAIDPLEAEDELQAAMYETGEISLATYRKYLQSRQATMVKFSAEWMAAYRQIRDLNEEEAAALKKVADLHKQAEEDAAAAKKQAADDMAEAKKQAEEEAAAAIALQDKIQKHLYDSGHITLEQYKAYLVARQEGLDQYSDEALDLWGEIHTLEAKKQDEAADAAAESADAARKREEDAVEDHLARIEQLYNEARARREADDAAAEADEAIEALSVAATKAYLYSMDKKRTQEEKDLAMVELEAAKTTAAEALFKRADALANKAGIADGTPEWAAAVRSALEGDKINAPGLAGAIDKILSGIPMFAKGGIMPGPKGKHSLAYVAGGERVLTEAQATAGGVYYLDFRGAVGVDPPALERWLSGKLRDIDRKTGRKIYRVT